MESYLSKLPLKVLIEIAIRCMDMDFEYTHPYYDYDDNEKKLKSASNWVGLEDFNNIDVEFIAQFIDDNYNLLAKDEEVWRQNMDKFTIPSLKNLKVDYEIWGPATLTEFYKTTWQSYYTGWVGDAMQHEYRTGDWNYWDGEFQSYESGDFEIDNFRVNYVNDKDFPVKENILSKLIIENTNELLNNLTHDDLVKLRNLINQKLSS